MRTISRHSAFYDVLDALRKPGCAVCTLVARTRWRYLDGLAYEGVNDREIRAKIRAALGFCNRHAWYFVETVREVFGAAIIYRDILHTIQAATTSGDGLAGLESRGPCPACVAEHQSAADTLLVLSEALGEPELRDAFESSEGLCGPHLLQAMALIRPGARPGLLAANEEIWRHQGEKGTRGRWGATGAAGLFATDDRALAGGPAGKPVRVAPSPDGPYRCPVCAATPAELGRLTSWTSLDDGSGGLCNTHAWMSAGVGCQEIYQRQLSAIEKAVEGMAEGIGKSWLDQAKRALGRGKRRTEQIPSPLRCVACTYQAALEAALCQTPAQPLCVPHLRRAMQLQGPLPLAEVRPVWRELDELLGDYLHKEDYRFRDEPRGIEQKSPRWIVALISGAAGIR